MKYVLKQFNTNGENSVAIVRDDLHGHKLAIASSGILVEIKISEIVDEIRRLEEKKAQQEKEVLEAQDDMA